MRVHDILKYKGSTVITVHDDAPLPAALDILHDKRIGALVVQNAEGEVVGVLSERDVVAALAQRGAAILNERVRDLMTTHVFVCRSGDLLKDVMSWMTRHRSRHLPVVEEGQLHGLISIGDVVRHRVEEIETEASVLRDIVIATH